MREEKQERMREARVPRSRVYTEAFAQIASVRPSYYYGYVGILLFSGVVVVLCATSARVVRLRHELLARNFSDARFRCIDHSTGLTHVLTPTNLVGTNQSVALVGNGWGKRDSALIARADAIVRFNAFPAAPGASRRDRRTDIHMVNGRVRDCRAHARAFVQIECTLAVAPDAPWLCTEGLECRPTVASLDRLCYGDASRGFIALALLKHARAVTLWGFRGLGHYYERNIKMEDFGHAMFAEHLVLAQHGYVQ